MRRIVMFNRVTADGFFAATDGNLNWAVPEPALDQEAARALSGTGAMLLGRRTYDMFESFWPHAAEGAKNPHGRSSPEMLRMAEWINAADKIVISRNRKEVTWQNSRLLHDTNRATIEALKREPGGDIMIFGSASIVRQLTDLGLIDEYQFIVNPTFIGNGQRLIDQLSKSVRLELVEAKAYPAGNVKLRYSVAKK